MTDSAPAHWSRARLSRLAGKELRETLRDRRTVVTLLLMPVLLYPLMAVVFQQFVLTGSYVPRTARIYSVGFVESRQFVLLTEFLQAGGVAVDDVFLTDEQAEQASERLVPADRPAPPAQFRAVPVAAATPAIEKNEVALVLTVADRPRDRFTVSWQATYAAGDPAATAALARLEEIFIQANLALLRGELSRGLGRPVADNPLVLARQPLALAGEERGGANATLLSLIPLVLILMTITGAVYPAIDLTAGERERGTLEMLIASPAPRLGLLAAKYVAVVTVAILTATVNLLAMAATLAVSGLGRAIFGGPPAPLVLVQIFGLLVLLSAFYGGVLLAICSFARSFKEAQAYLIPVMLLSLAPGLVGLSGTVRLDGVLQITPLLNLVLLARDLLAQQADPVATLVTVLSTLLYAALALAAAARLFGGEGVLYANQGGWSAWLTRPDRPDDAWTLDAALLYLVLLFPATFFLSSLVAADRLSIATRLSLNAAILLTLFAGVPAMLSWWWRTPPRTAAELRLPRLLAWAGAAALGLALWPFAYEWLMLVERLGGGGLDGLVGARAMVDTLRSQVPAALVLLTLAIVPAACEELFFRGFLQTAAARRLRPLAAVALSATLFGAFHLVQPGTLPLGRFVSTTALGLVLGWVRHRSGSVLPGMLLHVMHNGLLLSLALFQDRLGGVPLLRRIAAASEGETHLPAALLAVSAVVAVVGAVAVWWTGRRQRPIHDRHATVPPHPITTA